MILVIDDEPDLVDMLTETLTAEGFEARGATSLLEGLVQLRSEKFDIALIDYGLIRKHCMPPCSACELNLPEFLKVKVIYMSGRPDLGNEFKCASAFLQKPFDSRRLTELVRPPAALIGPSQAS